MTPVIPFFKNTKTKFYLFVLYRHLVSLLGLVSLCPYPVTLDFRPDLNLPTDLPTRVGGRTGRGHRSPYDGRLPAQCTVEGDPPRGCRRGTGTPR